MEAGSGGARKPHNSLSLQILLSPTLAPSPVGLCPLPDLLFNFAPSLMHLFWPAELFPLGERKRFPKNQDTAVTTHPRFPPILTLSFTLVSGTLPCSVPCAPLGDKASGSPLPFLWEWCILGLCVRAAAAWLPVEGGRRKE